MFEAAFQKLDEILGVKFSSDAERIMYFLKGVTIFRGLNLKHVLKNISKLKFDDSAYKFSDKNVRDLSEVLKQNNTLEHLDLSICKISSKGARHLSNLLKQNSTLKSLKLYGNEICANGAEYLSNALEENKTLLSLHLGWNKQIGAVGFRYLFNGLKKNTTLKSLNLSHCLPYLSDQEISPQSFDALKSNTSLESLDLSYNRIGNNSAKALLKALDENTSIIEIKLRGNEINNELLKQFKQLIHRNKSKRRLLREKQLLPLRAKCARKIINEIHIVEALDKKPVKAKPKEKKNVLSLLLKHGVDFSKDEKNKIQKLMKTIKFNNEQNKFPTKEGATFFKPQTTLMEGVDPSIKVTPTPTHN